MIDPIAQHHPPDKVAVVGETPFELISLRDALRQWLPAWISPLIVSMTGAAAGRWLAW
jgi:hypothetical protein